MLLSSDPNKHTQMYMDSTEKGKRYIDGTYMDMDTTSWAEGEMESNAAFLREKSLPSFSPSRQIAAPCRLHPRRWCGGGCWRPPALRRRRLKRCRRRCPRHPCRAWPALCSGGLRKQPASDLNPPRVSTPIPTTRPINQGKKKKCHPQTGGKNCQQYLLELSGQKKARTFDTRSKKTKSEASKPKKARTLFGKK